MLNDARTAQILNPKRRVTVADHDIARLESAKRSNSH